MESLIEQSERIGRLPNFLSHMKSTNIEKFKYLKKLGNGNVGNGYLSNEQNNRIIVDEFSDLLYDNEDKSLSSLARIIHNGLDYDTSFLSVRQFLAESKGRYLWKETTIAKTKLFMYILKEGLKNEYDDDSR